MVAKTKQAGALTAQDILEARTGGEPVTNLAPPNFQILRAKEVCFITGLGVSFIYQLMAENSFPKAVSLGGRAKGWVLQEVLDWVAARIAARDKTQKGAQDAAA